MTVSQGENTVATDSAWALASGGETDETGTTALDHDTGGQAMYKLTGVTKDYRRGQSVVHALREVNLVALTGPRRARSSSTARTWPGALVPLRVAPAGRRSRAAAALADVGLSDRASHLPGELSGGQQQRVAIARALVKEPTVVLADEPSGNLDEDTRDDIIALLDRLWRKLGLTLVVVTHDRTVARHAQRLGVLRDGA
jgi:ABC-type dipeptide/oligopeptide/nickel transport system ATPase component